MKLIILYGVDNDERVYVNVDMIQSIEDGYRLNGKETSVIHMHGQRVTVFGNSHTIASIAVAEEENGKFNDYRDWESENEPLT